MAELIEVAAADPAADVGRVKENLPHLAHGDERLARKRRDVQVHVLHEAEVKLEGARVKLPRNCGAKKRRLRKNCNELAQAKALPAPPFADGIEVVVGEGVSLRYHLTISCSRKRRRRRAAGRRGR